jgi:2-keto-4-pentenoate hydratase/2-oxohepta-3-ene-1,7-dioic acid hydratase in catechol pathway
MSYKLLTYASERGPRAGLLVGQQVIDAADATGNTAWSTVLGALQSWREAHQAFSKVCEGGGIALGQTELLAPVLYPGDIYCAGSNYQDHVDEMDRKSGRPKGKNMKELGERPWFFVKSGRSAVVGPGAAVKLPTYSQAVDWELELAAVIGQEARNVSAKDALDCIAGYTIANDLSARDAMKRAKVDSSSPFHYDWLSQKCFDGACPIGPWMVPAADVGDPHNLDMKLWIGDELMQDSNTKEMIFSIAEQIEMLSSRVTLYPGDLVLTGTPAGVGAARKRFLRPGEKLRLYIEKLGELAHFVV